MFERFSGPAREAVVVARAEAERRGHNWVGTEHLLVALTEVGGPAAAALPAAGVGAGTVRSGIDRHLPGGLDGEALAALGIDLDEVRRATEAGFGPGALERHRRGGRPRFTRRAKKVLELGLREAAGHHDDHISDGHLLLGLLREGKGLGARILTDADVDFAALRADLTSRLVRRAA